VNNDFDTSPVPFNGSELIVPNNYMIMNYVRSVISQYDYELSIRLIPIAILYNENYDRPEWLTVLLQIYNDLYSNNEYITLINDISTTEQQLYVKLTQLYDDGYRNFIGFM
jgi:hypothetical protein